MEPCCCKGAESPTPAGIENPPGRSSLAYRVGTHGRFRASMLLEASKAAALDRWTAREDDDPGIALLDAWATVLDVLTFYQERIANEAYLRTATERRSVLELARSIGYSLKPGVAAETYAAFELESSPASPETVPIAAGTRIQSLPGPDEKPQVFETVEPITARRKWNAIRPRMSAPHTPHFGDTEAWLAGSALNLKKGDGLLFVGQERLADKQDLEERWDFRILDVVEPAKRGITRIAWKDELGWSGPKGKHTLPAERDFRVYAFRSRAALFGHNAPQWFMLWGDVRAAYATKFGGNKDDPDWPTLTITHMAAGLPAGERNGTIFLDAAYPAISKDSWVVLSRPGYIEAYLVKDAKEDALSDFSLSGKSTRLKLEGEGLTKFDHSVRETVVYAQSEELKLAETPIDGSISGNWVSVTGDVKDLVAEQPLMASDKDSRELVKFWKSEPDGACTKVYFTANLKNTYDRQTFSLNANVAKVTHGETKREVLGSGNGSAEFQKFTLKHQPLTYAQAPTPSGAASTLAVRVNGVEWQETPSLYGHGPRERVYVTSIADDGKATVQFGDGATGSRLPTGIENVTAVYRAGTGSAGNVRAGQLSLLLTRPLGVKGVVNPEAASGGDDPESLADARRNAPLKVLTFDRVVSLRDYEDFARTYAAIRKARAEWVWDGEARVVHITVAGAGGATLAGAIAEYGDPHQPVVVEPYHELHFDVGASLAVKAGYDFDLVKAAVAAALKDAYSFEMRSFGQRVTTGEVLAAIQAVEGVAGTHLLELHLTGAPAPAANIAVNGVSLLLVNPAGITLDRMNS